jgi:hypothetical protein
VIAAEQASFSGGEIAPELAARVDVARYQSAVRLARNVIGLRQVGVANRPGTLLVGQVRNNGRKVRLIPFQFSSSQAYCLELGHLTLRAIRDGAYVTRAPQPVSVAAADPLTLQFDAPHGLAWLAQVFLDGFGGLIDGDGLSGVNGRTFRVLDAADPEAVVLQALGADPNDPDAGFDASGLTPWSSGGTAAALFELATPYRIDADLGVDDLPGVRFEQSADVMYLAHPAHPLMRLSRTGDADWSLEAVQFGARIGAPQDASAAVIPGTGAPDNRDARYVVTAFDDASGQESTASGPATASNDLTLAGARNQVSWSPPPGGPEPSRYFVYKAVNGLFGFIGAADASPFTDDNIDPDLATAPPIHADPLGAAGSRPGAIGFFEQRLFLGGPDGKPNGIWASRSGDFENLDYSRPVKADDAIAFAISARQVNRVLHLVPMADLLAFTSDTVFRVNGGAGEAVTPASIVVRPQVHRGASSCRPVVIDDAVLYVTAKGSRVRTLGYQLQADGYQGTDLTVFAPHLFQGRTVDEMAWCEHPHSAVFCKTSDGALLCLTWMIEQEVWGWSLLETDGVVESVCAVTETDAATGLGRDAVYLAVRRVLPGGSRRHVERLADPFAAGDDIAGAVYLDSAVRYAGPANDLFSGLEHLEGRAVKALADGNVVSGLTVADGRVTLPFEASQVTVGLPYASVVKTLTPVLQGRATQGRKVAISRATLRLLNTRGIKAGALMDRLEVIAPRRAAGWGEPADLVSGDVPISFDADPAPDAGVIVRQDEPLPMTLLGVWIEAEVGG